MLLVALKCKTHGQPNHAGSYYSSPPFDRAANGVLTCSRAAMRHRHGQGQEQTCQRGTERPDEGRAAPGKQDREGIKGSRSKGR